MGHRSLFTGVGLLLMLSCSTSFAQSGGSGGGAFSNAFLIPTIACQAGSNSFGSTLATNCTNSVGTVPVLFANFKVSGSTNKNVLLLASLESSILTDTAIVTNGSKSTATAEAALVVVPTVFECIGTGNNPCSSLSSGPVGTVYPNHVVFNERMQTLTANLLASGNCTTTAGITTCTGPGTIELLLSTMSANSFNFAVAGLPGAGVYQAQLGVFLETTATTNSILAGATAEIALAAGSLIDLDVNAETPFDTIKFCSTPVASGTPGVFTCGP